MTSRRRTTALWLATIAVSLTLLFVGLEVTLRAYQWVARGVPVMSFFPQWRETTFQLSPLLTFGPRLDYQIQGRRFPDLAYFDSLGFRTNEPVAPKPEGEFRIIAVGGSTTENIWNEAGLHWPLVLECRLRDAGFPNVRVLNSGMSAYTTAHTIVRLAFDLLDYDPDMVIVMHNINDLSVVHAAERLGVPVDGHYAAKYTQQQYTGYFSSEDVVLSRVWHSVMSRLRPSEEPPSVGSPGAFEAGRQVFDRNLRTITDLIRARGAHPVLLSMPFQAARVTDQEVLAGQVGLADLPEPNRFEAQMTAYNGTVREVAEATEATFVDMARLLAGADSLFVDSVHYKTEGIKRFGELLAAELSDEIPAPVEPMALSSEATRRCAW